MIFFGDRGIPASYRKMHGFGTNTYAFVNAEGKFFYCKFHHVCQQPIENLSSEEAQRIAGIDPDYHTRDLYNAIENGDYPAWNMFVQIMTPEQAAVSPYDPFDDTKVWLKSEYPLIPVGRFVLNKNPNNYFAQIEQIGFDPAHLVPGIEPSPDRMLQGRLFAYGDTHRYRLGPNYLQFPVNRPFKVSNFSRDGEATYHSQGGSANYHPNSFGGPEVDKRARSLAPVLPLHGDAKRIDNGNDDNFTQPRMLYQQVMKPDERGRLIQNIVSWLKPTRSDLQERAIDLFTNVDADLGLRIKTGLNTSQYSSLLRDASSNQLLEYAREKGDEEKESITTASGNPVGNKDASLTVGYSGPILLQDAVLIDQGTHPRKGGPCQRSWSFWILRGHPRHHPIHCCQVAGEMGYPDTVRDVRGFAIKFYTEDGIWDLVGNNLPTFFVKDSILFPDFIHTLKRNPKTHIRPDYDMFWDFISLRAESTHTMLMMFSDRGIPNSYRHQHGYGVANLSSEQAERIAGNDPEYLIRDLYNNIENGNYPSWNFYIQIMTPEQAAKSPYDPFDDSKVWLHADYPLIPVGRFVLNRNPKNYFAEVEQIAFDVAHLIPGIEPSPDRMVQGRLFNYGDTHRYRIGINNTQLPVNSPFRVANYLRDGRHTIQSQALPIHGDAKRIDSGNDDNFTQPGLLYRRVLNDAERGRLVDNIVSWLKRANTVIQERTITNILSKVDEDLGRRVREGINNEQAQTTVAL
nr:unnamed protein product [Callosobruchus chinensis]